MKVLLILCCSGIFINITTETVQKKQTSSWDVQLVRRTVDTRITGVRCPSLVSCSASCSSKLGHPALSLYYVNETKTCFCNMGTDSNPDDVNAAEIVYATLILSATPFEQKVGKLYPGKMIFISGIPHPNAIRFNVNLVHGDERAFHFDVRIAYGDYGSNTLVWNSRLGNIWGHEERYEPFYSFQTDKYFEMTILIDHNGYTVSVNNKQLPTFNHRVQPYERFDTLTVHGDVKLIHVRF